MTDTATAAPDVDAALVAAAAPGRAATRAAAVLNVVQTAMECVQWAGIAVLAEQLVDGADPATLWRGPALALLGGVLAAAARRAAADAAEQARSRIALSLRERLVAGALPDAGRRQEPEPAAVAGAVVELTGDIADYHAAALPLRASAPLSMAFILLATGLAHWPAAVVLVLATIVVPFNMWLAGLLARDGNDRYLGALNRLGAVVLDSFRGLPTLRRLGAVERRASTIDSASRELATANLEVLRRAFVSGVVMDVVITLSIAVAATYIGMTLLGYVTVPGTSRLDLGHGLFVLMLCPMYFAPMRRMAAAFHDRERALTAMRGVAPLLAPAAPAETGITRTDPADRPWRISATRLVLLDDTGHELIDAEEFRAESGQWTAIVGVSGAGKTTLLRLLAGLTEPDAGTVRWESESARVAPTAGAAAWIGQGTLLVAGTLADNLRLGAPDADRDRLDAAVEAVGLAPLVARLPDGLDTRLDGGPGLDIGTDAAGAGPTTGEVRRLSAGESRRVAIARALLRGARLWILDEPTAHLDPAAEAEVLAALQRASAGCTVIVATHAGAVVRAADARWQVEHGVVSRALAAPVSVAAGR